MSETEDKTSTTSSKHTRSITDIAEGKQGWVVSNDYLAPLVGNKNEDVEALLNSIEKVVNELRIASLDEIFLKFAIGKCGVGTKAGTAFDPKKVATWKYAATDLGSLGSRWNTTYKMKNFNALIPIGAVTKSTVPTDYQNDSEGYSLWLEQNLQNRVRQEQQFNGMLLNGDHYAPGNKTKNASKVNFLIYIAVQITPPEPQFENELQKVDYLIAMKKRELAELEARRANLAKQEAQGLQGC